MKFSFAAVTAFLAVGAVASVANGGDSEEYTTVVVTDYTTYCPSSTTLVAGTETVPVETPGTVTLSNGPYTVTRPLLTTTITRCKACSTPTPTPSSSIPVIPTSVPTSVNPTGTTTPSPPAFTGGASRAAAGAGAVAGLFGVVAALL
ncbi:putative GPI anchored protein [Aspergillus lucknowensis]|uniref:Clock-controlled protein n=1 Tax=Aspergillus lucknowensis TaxID=176173 RepID=A0ABR4M6S7_9EURO